MIRKNQTKNSLCLQLSIVGFGCLLLVASGCVDKPQPPPPTPPRPAVAVPTAPPAAAVQQIASSVRMPPAQVNQQDFSSKKDPFKPFISVRTLTAAEMAKQSRALKPLLPLHSFDVSQFRLIGTVVDARGNKAMVVDPSQKGYVLKVGMTIGKNEGKIVKIDPTGVDVVEQFHDDNNKLRKETIRIPLLRKP